RRHSIPVAKRRSGGRRAVSPGLGRRGLGRCPRGPPEKGGDSHRSRRRSILRPRMTLAKRVLRRERWFGEMLVETARFGSIEVDEERIIHFAKGVPGFEHVRQFVLVTPNEESPFSILQSVDEPGLAFVVTSPLWFRPDYRVEARRE